MPHCLIVGRTESGKTSLAKRLAQGYSKRDVPLIILDPMLDPEWPDGEHDFKTDNPNAFLECFWKSAGAAVFIDEAAKYCSLHAREFHETAQRGRHQGHNVHYITQRAKSLAPDVRTNVQRLYVFGCTPEDAKILYQDWAKPELLEAANLKQGEFIECNYNDAKKYVLFRAKNS